MQMRRRRRRGRIAVTRKMIIENNMRNDFAGSLLAAGSHIWAASGDRKATRTKSESRDLRLGAYVICGELIVCTKKMAEKALIAITQEDEQEKQ